MTTLRLNIAVDDVHPENGWGLPDDECMALIHEIHNEFGAKFTFFIPSNYHRKYPLSQYKDWIKWLKTFHYIELAAHGHYHDTIDSKSWGECEFAEIHDSELCQERLGQLNHEWIVAGHVPIGWRNPGWLCHPNNVHYIGEMFRYVALHTEHNRGMRWSCVELYGCDGIHSPEITIHNNDMLMFQSHIAGDWNDNRWNYPNYQQLQLSLRHLVDNFNIIFCRLDETVL